MQHVATRTGRSARLGTSTPCGLRSSVRPDLIKIILTGSELYKPATAEDPQLGKGIDLALVPLVTAQAHAAGLRVAVHIDPAHDFHVAVTGGVDILAHLPGYGMGATEDLAAYRLAEADV